MSSLPNLRAIPAPDQVRTGRLPGRANGAAPSGARQKPALQIPVVAFPKSLRVRDAHLDKGRHLARQENWTALSKLIRTADLRRLAVSDGKLVAEILADGARHDAICAAREAVAKGDPLGARYPVSALEEAMEDDMPDPALSMVVALAHLDVAGLWCSVGGLAPVKDDHHRAYTTHLAAAQRLIAPFDAIELDSPLLATLRCRLLRADLRPRDRVADDYEDLIDLAPQTPCHLRALGLDLLPRRYGGYDILEQQARRTADRTRDIWGQGGYAWVYFDALAHDPGALRKLDADRFVTGLHDIVERRCDQHMINLLAAFTGLSMAGNVDRRPARARVAAAFDWIVRDHLREVHPLVWNAAPAPGGSDPAPQTRPEQIARGRYRALSTLGDHFAADLQAGRGIVFGEGGLTVGKAG